MVTYRWLSNKILKPQEERIRAKAQKEVQGRGQSPGTCPGTCSGPERRTGAGAAHVGRLVPPP